MRSGRREKKKKKKKTKNGKVDEEEKEEEESPAAAAAATEKAQQFLAYSLALFRLQQELGPYLFYIYWRRDIFFSRSKRLSLSLSPLSLSSLSLSLFLFLQSYFSFVHDIFRRRLSAVSLVWLDQEIRPCLCSLSL